MDSYSSAVLNKYMHVPVAATPQSLDAAVAQQWREHTVDTLAQPSSAQWLQLLHGYAPAAVISVQTADNTLRNRYFA
jgi:hypothetical protein